MPPELEIQLLRQQVQVLTQRLDRLERSGKMYFTKDIELPKDIGVKFGTHLLQKLSFWGVTPVTQYGTNGGNAGHYNTGSGNTVKYDDKFSGSTSSGTQYYINDIVQALKDCGILKV